MVLVFSFSISLCAYYDFLSPESNINIEKLKQKYKYTPIINIDTITSTLIDEQDLNDYDQVGESVLIPASPELLEKIENEEYQYNPPVVNYWQKKEKINEINNN
jgi:hypothetical protein